MTEGVSLLRKRTGENGFFAVAQNDKEGTFRMTEYDGAPSRRAPHKEEPRPHPVILRPKAEESASLVLGSLLEGAVTEGD